MRSETYMSQINLQRGKLTVENMKSREKKRTYSEVSVNSPGNPWRHTSRNVSRSNRILKQVNTTQKLPSRSDARPLQFITRDRQAPVTARCSRAGESATADNCLRQHSTEQTSQERTWLSPALCVPVQYTSERQRKCTRQSRSCL